MCGGLRSLFVVSVVVVVAVVAVARTAAAKVEKGGAVARGGRGSFKAPSFYSRKPSCLGQQQSPFAATCCNCCRIKCAVRLRRISLLLWSVASQPPSGFTTHPLRRPCVAPPILATLVDCTPPAEISLHFIVSDFRERRCSRLL